jgi:hypothetical protein
MGSLELVAALCVNVGGFPKVGLSLAASGEPLVLVASAKSWGHSEALDYDALADAMVDRMERRQAVTAALTSKKATLLAELDDSPARMATLLAEFEDDEDALVADISTMPPQLQESYLHGKVAARIQWGEPGDFKRCVAQAKIHGMGHMADGACNTLHHKALGVYPGQEHGKPTAKK